MFPSASYQYVLYGMGFKSAVTTTQLRNNPYQKEVAIRCFADARKKAQRYSQHLPTNRFLMNQVKESDFAAI
jgi:hypothetical protein